MVKRVVRGSERSIGESERPNEGVGASQRVWGASQGVWGFKVGGGWRLIEMEKWRNKD